MYLGFGLNTDPLVIYYAELCASTKPGRHRVPLSKPHQLLSDRARELGLRVWRERGGLARRSDNEVNDGRCFRNAAS